MMKNSLSMVLVAGALLAGCGGSGNEPARGTNATAGATNAAAPGSNPLNAPADYLGGLAKSKTLAEKTVDAASLNKAVQMFNATEGRNPKDLNELVTTKYLPRIPEAPPGMRIEYDAASGEVKVVKN